MQPREASEYDHYADQLLAEADPCGAYLAAQVQKQFDAIFPERKSADESSQRLVRKVDDGAA